MIELKPGCCVGAEALARWVRKDGEVVRPDLFIPLAEVCGLVPDITLAILAATLRDLGDLLRREPNLCIKLEITERAMVNTDQSRKLISQFRRQGHQVAVDDFGTGYSSLAYLESFELDTLKIDKTFVDAIGTDAVTNHVTGHVIDMAKSLQLDTMAEGIETVQQATRLIEQGVEYGLGYLYSRPLPPKELRDFVRDTNQKSVHQKL